MHSETEFYFICSAFSAYWGMIALWCVWGLVAWLAVGRKQRRMRRILDEYGEKSRIYHTNQHNGANIYETDI